MKTTELNDVIQEYVDAVNASDIDRILAAFAEDAFVNDARREIRGVDAIRKFAEKEIVGDNLRIDVIEIIDHHGQAIVKAAFDGDFDETNLPDPLVLTSYFGVDDGMIVSMVTILNKPSEY
jgi:hypothetical protein